MSRARSPRCWRKSLGGAVKGHYMSAMPFLYGARYITCTVPGCSRVKRNNLAWPAMRPLIHNGRKPH